MQDAPYRLIPLVNRRSQAIGLAIVDEADYWSLSRFRWSCQLGYAVHFKGSRQIAMHRLVLGLKPGDELEGDHINRDRSDNRRSNLRAVTHAENMCNQPAQKGSRSRFRGVFWEKEKRKWRAQTKVHGKKVHHGYFEAEEEAGAAARSYRLSIGWPD